MLINHSQIDYDSLCKWRGGDRVCTVFAVWGLARVNLPFAIMPCEHAERRCSDDVLLVEA